MKNKKRIKLRGGDLVFTCVNSFLLTIAFIIVLYPLLFVISASFSEPQAVASGQMILLPVEPSLQAYKFILDYDEIWIGYANTIFYTFFGTLVNLILTIPCAYALSRRDCPLRALIMTLFMITMYFGGGLIPGYLNVKDLGLLNTRWIMLISGGVSTYNLIVARTFFANTIPWELHEAAALDGCSDMKMLLKIVLPLSSPIIVVLMLYYGVGHWNSYFNAMIYLSSRDKYPLQIFLREILTVGKFADAAFASGDIMSAEEAAALLKQVDTANMIKYAVIVAATAPMMAIYPWLQKYFAKGVMIGSVKG
ncbi:MAG: carbohydrate ABC transporter permease [Clostridia bacterium]|nr:carbohydrate ABC transporter permease [Clostridia bacterium]